MGAGFSLSTLGGYLLTLWIGLFGFREVRTAAGIVAGVIEVLAFCALGAFALVPRPGEPHEPKAGSQGVAGSRGAVVGDLPAACPGARLAVALLSVAALAVLGVSAALEGHTSTTQAGEAILKTGRIAGVSVITDAQGYTLYWFVPDTSEKSRCYGTCAVYWPPVTGTPQGTRGVTGRLGSIKRAGGQAQVTYDGHPLYSYIGDSAPGQATGNDITLNGGKWYEMAVAG
jgi:predicted lipoprotein with Yx(FWY)xxD motif